MKKKQQELGLVRYNGVKDNISCTGLYSSTCYDEDDNSEEYISSNLFGKLKYDDIRKVHKDQTILAVDEMDYGITKKWKNAEDYRSARGNQDLSPINQEESLNVIENRRKHELKNAAERKYKNELKMMDTRDKMKSAISQFFMLQS